jgi:plastocyanin
MSYAFCRNTTHPLRACAVLALVFCASFVIPAVFAAAAPSAPSVDISKFAFAPKEITIAPGTKII